MSVENLTKLYVHINKFGVAAGRVVNSKDLCDPYINYEELVKFEEAVEASSNSLQQLKAEIALLLNTWDNTTKQQFLDTWVLRINKLRQLSAV